MSDAPERIAVGILESGDLVIDSRGAAIMGHEHVAYIRADIPEAMSQPLYSRRKLVADLEAATARADIAEAEAATLRAKLAEARADALREAAEIVAALEYGDEDESSYDAGRLHGVRAAKAAILARIAEDAK